VSLILQQKISKALYNKKAFLLFRKKEINAKIKQPLIQVFVLTAAFFMAAE